MAFKGVKRAYGEDLHPSLPVFGSTYDDFKFWYFLDKGWVECCNDRSD